MFPVPCSHVNCNGFNLPEMIVSLIRQQLLSFVKRPKGSKRESLTSEQVEAAGELETNHFLRQACRNRTSLAKQGKTIRRRRWTPEQVSLSVMSTDSDHCRLQQHQTLGFLSVTDVVWITLGEKLKEFVIFLTIFKAKMWFYSRTCVFLKSLLKHS